MVCRNVLCSENIEEGGCFQRSNTEMKACEQRKAFNRIDRKMNKYYREGKGKSGLEKFARYVAVYHLWKEEIEKLKQ